MRKDWVVWVGCISLFATGVVWGGVPIGTNFFKVDNVHDLFEIAGAGATAIAVCIAAAGLNAWKLQILAASDHDLARRAAVALHSYQAAVLRGCQVAEFLVLRVENNIGKKGITAHQSEDIRWELESLQKAIANVKVVALECRVVWGADIWGEFQQAFVPGDKYLDCIDGFLRWSRVETTNTVKDAIAEQIIDSRNYVVPLVGEGKASVEKSMENALSPLYTEIQRRFLRRKSS